MTKEALNQISPPNFPFTIQGITFTLSDNGEVFSSELGSLGYLDDVLERGIRLVRLIEILDEIDLPKPGK